MQDLHKNWIKTKLDSAGAFANHCVFTCTFDGDDDDEHNYGNDGDKSITILN